MRRGSGSGRTFLIVAGLIALAIGVGAVLVLRRNQSAPYRIKKLKAEIARKIRKGESEAAARALEQLLALDPGDVSQAALLARLYRELGEVERAEAVLRGLHERLPDDLSLTIALGELLLDEGRLPEVHALLDPLVAGLTEHPDVQERSRALVLLGQSHTLAGDPEAALPLLREAVKLRQTYGLQASKLETGDARVTARRALGDALIASGRWGEAEEVLREAYQAAPDGIELNLALARVLDHAGRTEQAVELLERLVAERHESRNDVLPRLSAFLLRIDQVPRLEALARTLEQDPPSQPLAAYLRGRIALEAGRTLDAERELTRAVELLPDALPPRLLLARCARLRGQRALAEASYRRALALEPRSAEAALGLLALEAIGERPGAARERALGLLDRSSTRTAAVALLLRRAYAGDDPAPALAALEQLLGARPQDTWLALFVATFRVLAGQASAPEAAALQTLAARPRAALQGALGLGEDGEGLEALELLARTARQDPRLTPLCPALAALCATLGREDLAARLLDAASRARPDLTEARLARAELARARGELDLAAAIYAELLQHDPERLELLVGLSAVHLAQGAGAQALAQLDRAAAAHPEDAALQARRGRVLALLERPDDALAAFARARELDPELASAHFDGAVLALGGDFAGAKRAFRRGASHSDDPRLVVCAVLATAGAGEVGDAASQVAALGPDAGVLPALLEALEGDPRGAEVALSRAELALPWAASRALLDLRLEPGRPVLLSAILEALGWELERGRVLRQLAGSSDPFLAWWSLRGLRGTPEALAAAQRVASLGEDRAAWLRAVDELALASPAEVTSALRGVRGRFPRDPEVALRASVAWGPRDPELAQALAVQAASEDPGPAPLIQLAQTLALDPLTRGAALSHARRAARLAPELALAQATLGRLAAAEGRPLEAQTALLHAARLDPRDPALRLDLARALAAGGQPTRAADHLAACLAAAPEGATRAAAEAFAAELAAPLVDRPDPVGTDGHSGSLRGPGVVALALAPGASAEVGVAAVATAALSVELLERRGGGERVARRLRVPAGGSRELGALTCPADGTLALRLTPVGPDGGGYRLQLAPLASAAELEPNDRLEAAQELGVERERAGTLGSGDLRDCYRIAAAPGTVVWVTLSPQRAAELSLRVWEPAAQGGLVPRQRYRTQGISAAVAPRWRVPAAGALVLSVEADDLSAPLGYQLRVQRAADTADAELEPNDLDADASGLVRGRALSGALDGAEREWFQVPALGGALCQLQVRGRGLSGATLGAYAWFEGKPQRLGAWRCGPEGLTVEALDLPNASRLALLLVQDRTSSTPWRLTLDTTPRALGREAEPNDDPRQAQPLSGDALRGSLAGPGDRDVILVEAGRSVRIENVGDVALALRAWEGEQPLVVAPGAHGLLPRERLIAREDQARVVVEAAPGESGAGARYVLSQ